MLPFFLKKWCASGFVVRLMKKEGRVRHGFFEDTVFQMQGFSRENVGLGVHQRPGAERAIDTPAK